MGMLLELPMCLCSLPSSGTTARPEVYLFPGPAVPLEDLLSLRVDSPPLPLPLPLLPVSRGMRPRGPLTLMLLIESAGLGRPLAALGALLLSRWALAPAHATTAADLPVTMVASLRSWPSPLLIPSCFDRRAGVFALRLCLLLLVAVLLLLVVTVFPIDRSRPGACRTSRR